MDLLEAVKTGSLETIQQLIEQQGIPNDSEWTDYAALDSALKEGRKDVALYLLQKNCRVNKTTESETAVNTPLHKAVKLKDEKLVIDLLTKEASVVAVDSDGNSPLHLAFLSKSTKIIDRLLTHMEERSNFVNVKNKQGLTHLHIACTRSNARVIEGILKTKTHIEDSVDRNSSLWPGYTAIHFAVEYTSVLAVKILSTRADLQFGQAKNQRGHTALQLVHSRIQKLVETRNLLTHDFRHFQNLIDDPTNRTRLHKAFYAAKYVDCYSVKEAFNGLKDKTTNHTDEDGLSHLHVACTTEGRVKIVENYLNNGADVNARVSFKKRAFYNFTPLHFAVMYEKTSMAKFLIARGADVDANDDNVHGTPLHVALKSRHEAMVELLLERGADVKSVRVADGGTTLHALVEDEYVKSYRERNVGSRPALLEYVKRLVDLGVDVDARDREGNTALYLVCREESALTSSVVGMLLECGADVDLKNEGDTTAFGMMCHDDRLFTVGNDDDKCKILYDHVQNLKALGLFVSPEVEQCCRKFEDKAMETQSLQFVKDTFVDQRQNRLGEVVKLKHFKVDSTDSLHDFLEIKAKSSSKYLTNACLKAFVESANLGKEFPIFAYLIRLKYKKIRDCHG